MSPVASSRAAPVLLALVAALLVAFAPVRYTTSDAFGTLLLSQALVQEGTIRLDHYGGDRLAYYPVTEIRGHSYYLFPIGSSLLSVPFVAVANAFGIDMLDSEERMQIVIACVTTALTVLAMFQLALLFVSRGQALLLTAVFWAGTSLSSTAGTALWSHDFTVLLAFASLYVVIQLTRHAHARFWPALAALLFLAYLCRPTAALLAVFVLMYLACYDRKAACKVAGLLAVLLGSFVLFNWYELGQLLPDYYSPQRLGSTAFATALLGNLISPARGLLVYSPFIVLLLVTALRQRVTPPLYLLALAWPLVHLLVISQFAHWWAGHSYGTRLLTDALPGLFILCACGWPRLAVSSRAVQAVFAMSALFAIHLNARQGLYDEWTHRWNAEPNVDIYQEYLFDWRYPPFLHDEHRHAARLREHAAHTFAADSERVAFSGWAAPKGWVRWSTSRSPRIVLNGSLEHAAGELAMRFCTFGQQRVRVSLNGALLSEFTHADRENEPTLFSAANMLRVNFPPTLLSGESNVIELALPDAKKPANGDPRTLGLCLFYVTLR